MITHDDWVISQPTDTAELSAVLALWHQAFLMPMPSECDTPAKAGLVNPQVLIRDGAVAAALDVLPMGQFFGGKSVPTGGVRGVAVAPEHRGAGLASHLVKTVLHDLKEAGFPLSTLYPATQPVYRKLGYEIAGTRFTYALDLAGVRAGDRGMRVRPVGEAERAILAEAYRQRAMRTAGNLNRIPWAWERLLNPKEGTPFNYLVEVEGSIEGYVLGTQKREGKRAYNLHLSDVVALTPRAAARLVSFLADHRSLAERAIWYGGPAEPWLAPLAEQDPEVLRRQPWMLRIVDVADALAARGYPEGLSLELHLAVTDDVLPWNQGAFVLEVASGTGRVKPGGTGGMKIDVRGLAALYSGYLSPAELLVSGYLEADAETMAKAAALFAGPAPWMPDMF